MRDRDKNDNGFFPATDIYFTGCGNLEHSELSFQFRDIVLEVDQGLSYIGLSLIRRRGRRIGGTKNFVCDGGHVEVEALKRMINIQNLISPSISKELFVHYFMGPNDV